MHRSPNKILVTLLAILLAVTPLQGAMAAVSASTGVDKASHAMMNMADGEQMTEMREMASGSGPCEQAGCCNGEGCAFGHCASCVVGAIATSFKSISVKYAVYAFWLENRLPVRNIPSIFRPPKA